jgi:hypothetical protein
MAPPHRRKARAEIPGLSEVHSAAVEHLRDNESPDSKQERKPLIDKHGNRYAESVLTNWSPQILRIMGVRRLDEKGGVR